MIANAEVEYGSGIFKALAHPTRLFIVKKLGEVRTMCVCEITDMVGDDMSTVSRHLAILRNAGVVENKKVGNEVHYSLAMPCVLEFAICIEKVMKSKRKELAHV